ncbi:hypothetical protein F5B19DRAFT_217276 [Rostrohypoxylon terebratum]|nr:hypothetical protein F5B19DRAFT_217276 [Rostrohypoxylon terebratum]
MFTTNVAVAALSALTLVSAQANSNSTFTIDPSTVDISDRVSWCQGQSDSCGTLCGSVLNNSCSTDTLDFSCECQGGNYPDMNKFENTMPWVRIHFRFASLPSFSPETKANHDFSLIVRLRATSK